MNTNFEALESVILTDGDYFIVQDKETGFKQKITKAQLATAIGGGGGFTLIERQTIADLTNGGTAISDIKRGGFFFAGLEALGFTRFKLVFDFMSSGGGSRFKSTRFPDIAFDTPAASTDYDNDGSWDIRPSGAIDNGTTVDSASAGGLVGLPNGLTGLTPLWTVTVETEFSFMDDTGFPGYKGMYGSYITNAVNWATTEKRGSTGSFSNYVAPGGYLAGNVPRNIWFIPHIELIATGSYDFTSDVLHCHCCLYGLE